MQKNLQESKKKKDDEYYTPYEEAAELTSLFSWRDKTVYCPCDKTSSPFVQCLIKRNARVFSSAYPEGGLYCNGLKIGQMGDGSFLGTESLNLARMCDCVVTNPPFSKIRRYVGELIGMGTPFLLIGPPDLADSTSVLNPQLQIIGRTRHIQFHYKNSTREQPIYWFAYKMPAIPPCSLSLKTKSENESKGVIYRYLREPAGVLEVSRSKLVPIDYKGVMAIPVTFLPFLNRAKMTVFDIICGVRSDGTKTYKRMLVQWKKPLR